MHDSLTGNARRPRTRRHLYWLAGAAMAATALAVAGCSTGSTSPGANTAATAATGGNTAASGGTKLILLELPFPCGLNDYATQTCNGAEAAAKDLPAGYSFGIKTSLNYTDTTSFNAVIQTSLQLKPAGLIVFANGVAAQTPYLNRGCAQGVKVIWYDTPGTGVTCALSLIAPNHYQLGVQAGKYLIAHPPANGSKQVAIVSQQPGEFRSNDLRVSGFTKTVEAAGYTVVQTVVSTNDLDQTRTGVTNMLTAHPGIGAVFAANGPLGDGAAEALRGNHSVVLLTTDGNLTDIPMVENGTFAADVAQDPYNGGKTAVEYMLKVLQGQTVPTQYLEPYLVVSRANAKAYIAAGGMH
jgi:ribose transport system substrate-binding protein